VFTNERQPAVLMDKFDTGDLVRVRPGVHQEGLPSHRTGIIVDTGGLDEKYQDRVYYILFLGSSEPMKFHNMFLEHFTIR